MTDDKPATTGIKRGETNTENRGDRRGDTIGDTHGEGTGEHRAPGRHKDDLRFDTGDTGRMINEPSETPGPWNVDPEAVEALKKANEKQKEARQNEREHLAGSDEAKRSSTIGRDGKPGTASKN